jgi:D-alanine transaminase
MARVAYVNRRFLPLPAARVHIEDRGFQFADGVYEVIPVQEGRLIEEAGHMDRLGRSLHELRMPWPTTRRVMALVMRELVRRNRLREGIIYLQVTRGSSPRDFRFPPDPAPTLVITARSQVLGPQRLVEDGVGVITIPDIRWKRRDIKSVSLLPQVLGKQRAAEAGAYEAWMVDEDGFVTEGTSSNAWIVNREGVLVTRQANHMILRGVTRQAVLRLLAEEGRGLEERPFTVDEAYQAREAFLTSSSNYVMPVTRIDDRSVGNGKPGSLVLKLRDLYVAYATGRTS